MHLSFHKKVYKNPPNKKKHQVRKDEIFLKPFKLLLLRKLILVIFKLLVYI